jgi:hypothetical protein
MNFLKKQNSIKGINDVKIEITEKGYDNISEILDLLGIKHKPFSGSFDCDILFINCKSGYNIDTIKLKQYVENGGLVYASDFASRVISASFPNTLIFGTSNKTGKITATVIDTDLKKHIGNNIEIDFDLSGWYTINKVLKGNVILLSKDNNLPIMVEIPIGKGKVYYTSFHNHKQTTDSEEKLLQLLVLKQIGYLNTTTIQETATQNNIDLDNLQYKMKMAGLNSSEIESLTKSQTEKPKFTFGKKQTFTFGEKTKNNN